MGMTPTINLSNVAVTDGLVGYWLGGVQGVPKLGTVLDLSGNGNHGACVADAFVNGDGLNLDGTGDHVQIAGAGFDFPFPNGDVTFSLWVKSNGAGQDGAGGTLFGHYAASRGYLVYLFADSRGLYHQVDAGGWTTNYAISTSVWRHIVFQPGTITVSRKFYVDGTLVASAIGAQPNSSVSSFYIGRYSSTDSQYFNGKLRDVRIYNRALSAAEIRQIYDSTKWRFQ